MNVLNNNVRSLVYVSLSDVLEKIYDLLCHWTLHNPFNSNSFAINGPGNTNSQSIYCIFKVNDCRRTLRRVTTFSPFGSGFSEDF